MSTTQDDNNRKHPRGGDEEGEEVNLLHDQQDQESSQKRPKVDDNTSAQTLSTTAEEDEVSVELVIGNSGDHVENAPSAASINTATAEVYDTTSTAEAPQQSVVSTTAPIARNTSIPEQEIPQYDTEYVNRLFCEKFKVGTWFDSAEELRNEVKQFANKYFFVMRKQTERKLQCSRSSNTNSRKKQSLEKAMTTKSFSVASNCPVQVRHSLRDEDNGKVQIKFVCGLHNHDLDALQVAVSQRLSGRNIESVLPLIAPSFAPLMVNDSPVDIETARKILRAHFDNAVSMKVESIHTILRAVKKYIKSDKYKPITPCIDSESMLSQFSTYVASDDATEKCSSLLHEVMMTNTSGDTSWKVLQLLERLKREDPTEFDFRIHKDSAGNIDAFTWQTGVHRAAFSLYGDALFLDARKKETMNVLGMKYMTLVVIDANNKFWPISHSFVFAEDHTLYEFACKATLEMTPARTKESVKLGYGDMFFEPERVKEWFPNMLMMIDAYHLIYAKNGQSILAKEFGPAAWNILQPNFVKALEAETEDEFDVSVRNFYLIVHCHCYANISSCAIHLIPFVEIYR